MLQNLKVEQNKENVVAIRLDGTWKVDGALLERLTGTVTGSIATRSTFTSDSVVAVNVPDKYVKWFIENKMPIYMAGTMQFEDAVLVKGNGADALKKLPFVLTNIHGNPHVLFWLEKDGEEFGNNVSFNVILAVARDKKEDLLFIGSNFNNQPFSAFGPSKLDDVE